MIGIVKDSKIDQGKEFMTGNNTLRYLAGVVKNPKQVARGGTPGIGELQKNNRFP